MKTTTLDFEIKKEHIQLGRGNIISSRDISRNPGDYPIYSSSAKGMGEFGRYGDYMFDEELITWSVDGGGRFFYRPKHKFSVTNVSGFMRIDAEVWNRRFVYYSLDLQHQKFTFDYQMKAHPSVIRHLYELVEFRKPEQAKIAEVLSTLDRVIEQTEALIAKQQRIKAGLMQDLLTRGIDEHGNLRSEQTHKFKDSPIGRIPVEWDIATVDQIASITTGDKDTQDADPSAEYPFFVRSKTVEKISSYSFDGEAVLTAGDGVGTGKVFHYFKGRFDFHQRVYCIHSFTEDMLGYYFFCHFQMHFMARVAQFSAKGSVDSVRRHMVAKMFVPVPSRDEQAQVVNILRSSATTIDDHIAALQKLRHLRAGLMHDLLTGKIRVTPLLEKCEEVTA